MDAWLMNWCRELWSEAPGKQFLLNLASDLDEDVLSKEVILKFFNKVKIHANTQSEQSPLQLLKKVIDHHKQEFSCKGVTEPIRETYCFIIPLDVFVSHYVVNPTALLFIGEGAGNGNNYDPAVIRPALSKINKQPQKWISKPLQRKDFYTVWVSKKSVIESRISKHKELHGGEHLADSLRDELGLSHYNKTGRQFIAIRVESKHKAFAPTAFDGGIHDCYRSKRNAKYPNWGTTINLTNAAWGLPEAVRTPWSSVKKMKVSYLGRVNTSATVSKELLNTQAYNGNFNQVVKLIGGRLDG